MRRTTALTEGEAGNFIEFSKGIAILLIAFHHFSRSLWLGRHLATPPLMQWTFDPAGESLGRSFSELASGQFDEAMFRLSAQFGYFGVHLFVLMSGLGLAWGTSKTVKTEAFLKRRISKLVPPFWTAVVVFVVWRIIIEQPYSVRQIIERATLLSTFDQTNFFRVDPPLWCLALFFQLYVLFLPLRYLLERFGPRLILLLFPVGFAARSICMLPGILRWNENFGHVLGLNWVAIFAAGIWVGNELRQKGRAAIPLWVFVSAASIGAGALFLSERFSAMYPIHDTAIAAVIGATSVIIWKAIPYRLLTRSLAAVGSVSFPLYLYHRPILGTVIFVWQKNPIQHIDAMSLSFVTVGALTVGFLLLRRLATLKIAVLALGVEPFTPQPVLVHSALGRIPPGAGTAELGTGQLAGQ